MKPAVSMILKNGLEELGFAHRYRQGFCGWGYNVMNPYQVK